MMWGHRVKARVCGTETHTPGRAMKKFTMQVFTGLARFCALVACWNLSLAVSALYIIFSNFTDGIFLGPKGKKTKNGCSWKKLVKSEVCETR